MPTVVHTGDIHLDTPFTARFTREQASLRRREVMHTFLRICQRAKSADIFLVAGDLFDGRFVSGETVAFLKRCFAEMPDTRVFLVAGNHDPLQQDSCYLAENWSENVHIFGTEMEYVDIPELKTRIHGRSFTQSHIDTPLLTSLSIAEDWCNILLLHGEVVATGGESAYNPIEKPVLAASGVDYAALGHIHLASGPERLGAVYYAYPGIPEGRGFDEAGTRGYLAGIVEKGSVQMEWVPVSKREFVLEHLDISDCTDSLQVVEKIKEVIATQGEEHCYRIFLSGGVSFAMPEMGVLAEQLKGYGFSIELRNETRIAYDMEALAKEATLRGAFVRRMLEEIAAMPEETKARGQLALTLGLEAMEGGRL